ncbi:MULTISPECIES: hypothetical protein [unclassified Sphingomonas]|jgi:hypothetical protein|uniref:hypothetical protein n=2 Tax=Sphingomonas TaxID=13687 RepID=UPI000AF089B1|nr:MULTISPECIES: hypothetical protein [unclassified Sphingomonas]MCH4894259.1 hypothetical protein [Sphingomonas sp. SFZ2018-12]
MAMGRASFLKAFGGNYLHLRFAASPELSVETIERPGAWLAPVDVERLVADCAVVVRACLGGRDLDYGLFGEDRSPWARSVITIVRRRDDGRPIAFNAMPILPVVRGGQAEEILHLGLVMIDPNDRGEGLSWVLYGFTCFALFVRRGLRSLWISSVTQVPAVVGLVAETFSDVYPAQAGTRQTFAHRHFAHQIMRSQRDAFGVGEDAGFDADAQVITDAYTGGSDNLKKTFAVAAKHRDPRYNAYCEAALDYARGDDVLQIGKLDLATARRYVLRMVPRGALPALMVQVVFIALAAVIAPTLQWLDPRKPHGRLRPA